MKNIRTFIILKQCPYIFNKTTYCVLASTIKTFEFNFNLFLENLIKNINNT